MRKVNEFFIILVFLVMGLVMGACQSTSLTVSAPSPEAAVIEALEAAIDAQDLDAIVALYAEDGVVREARFKGSKRIREFYSGYYILHGRTVDNTDIRVEDNKVLYVCTSINREGDIYARHQVVAVIENGKIKSDRRIESLSF